MQFIKTFQDPKNVYFLTEVPTAQELCKEVDVLGVLERLDELHDAWVIALGIDLALHTDGLLLPLAHHLVLAHTFQRVHALMALGLVVILVVHKLHGTEGPATYDGLDAQVRHRDTQVLQFHTVLPLDSSS